jgi:phosphoserine aminotransferase
MKFDHRVYNFTPGPSALPEEVLQQVADEMLNWNGVGSSMMELNHRSPEFMEVYYETQASLRELMDIPDDYEILMLQGGGIGQNAAIPMNLLLRSTDRKADFVVTGIWSEVAAQEAQKYGQANIAARDDGFTGIPERTSWNLSEDAAYVHICSNETVGGVEFTDFPDVGGVPLVADVSSNILSRKMDVRKCGVLFAAAQKNIGPAGVTVVIVQRDLLGHAMSITPTVWDWAKNITPWVNTPPTFAIYVSGLVLKWLKRQGGVAEMERLNQIKSDLLYDFIDSSSLYENRVNKDCRSRANITFYLKDEQLNEDFLTKSNEAGLIALRGHKLAGGMRACIYNAMPVAGVETLIDFMREFERRA